MGAVHVVIDGGPGLAGWIGLALTGVVALVTIVYVKITNDMVREMKRSRTDEADARRRDKSEAAARECLRALRDLATEIAAHGAAAVSVARFRTTRDRLLSEMALVREHEVHVRLVGCAEVLYFAGWESETLRSEAMSPGSVAGAAGRYVDATCALVESYIAERTLLLAPWGEGSAAATPQHLPLAPHVESWLRTSTALTGSN